VTAGPAPERRPLVCIDEASEIVLEAFTTLMGHEGDNSIEMKWDAESGQVMRTAAKD